MADLYQAPDDDGVDFGWNLPAPASREEVAAVLEDALAAVRAGDSWEGTITWLMPTDEAWLQGTDFGLMARYRVGNLSGQGGLRAFTKPRSDAVRDSHLTEGDPS